MQPAPFYDELVFEKTGAELQLTCSNPSLPTDSSNLVHRAALRFREAAGIAEGISIHLEKKLPIAAGIGAGSANAAATLLGLNELFGYPLPPETLPRLASELGSDVPFFLREAPALALGRGEKVKSLAPFPALKGMHLLLIHPGFGVSTPWAYKNLARFPHALNGTPGRAEALAHDLARGDLAAASSNFYNALEAPVLPKYPLLPLFQEFLREQGAACAMMSGSGSSTFALFSDGAIVEQASEKFRSKFGDYCWMAAAPLS